MKEPSNLPPGATESMLPGNIPEDVEYKRLVEHINYGVDKLLDRGYSYETIAEMWSEVIA